MVSGRQGLVDGGLLTEEAGRLWLVQDGEKAVFDSQ